MTASSLERYPQIIKQLIEEGAWLVPLRGRYGVSLPEGNDYDLWKQPTRSWRDRAACTADVLARLDGQFWVGLIPSSLGLVVLDVDEGDADDLGMTLEAQDYAFERVRTRRGWHVYLRAAGDWPGGNFKWSLAGCAGDVRFDAGYVIVWDPEALLRIIELGDDGVADAGLADRLRDKPASRQRSLLESTGGDIGPERYPPGARDDKLLTDLNSLAHRGLLDNEEVLDRYRRAWMEAPAPKAGEDRLAIFEDKVARAREHVSGQQAALLAEGVFPHKSAEVQRQALTRVGVAWAHNLRSGDYLYRFNGGVLVSEKAGAVEGKLREMLADNFKYERANGGHLRLKFTVNEFEDNMTALVGMYPDKSHDDFILWLERDLPEWDGVARIETLLIDLFKAEDTKLTRWASRFLFLGPIQRAYQPGCKLDETPVLIGKQGLGKSALLANLFPPEHRGVWFADAFDMTAPAKERMEATRGTVLVEIAEMAGVGREWQKQKAYLTSTHDRARMAYDRKTSNYPRRYCFVGTADRPEALPNDPAGLRRFVAVQLHEGANIEARLTEARLQLWAEGLMMYRTAAAAGETRIANLPRDLQAAQAEANEQFRYRDDQLEDAVAELEGNDLSWADIALAAGLPVNMNKNQRKRLTDALVHAGWKRVTLNVNGKRPRVWRKSQESRLL